MNCISSSDSLVFTSYESRTMSFSVRHNVAVPISNVGASINVFDRGFNRATCSAFAHDR